MGLRRVTRIQILKVIYSNEINPIDENKWTDLLEKKILTEILLLKL